MANVVIIGAGFAACTAVKTLRKQGYRETITLVAPRAIWGCAPLPMRSSARDSTPSA